MSTPYNNEERRFALRMSLRLPIVVSGRTEDGSAWSEPTETDDISNTGTLFHLNQKVNRGERLYIRAHRPDGAPIEVTAVVVRVAPAIYGTARVGVQIAEPNENWVRLFVSWVADEAPVVSDSDAPPPE
jgi:PilZ domain-containing protein